MGQKTFRSGEIAIVAGMTNGVEAQHKIFKSRYLHRKTNYSLYSMLEILSKESLLAISIIVTFSDN